MEQSAIFPPAGAGALGRGGRLIVLVLVLGIAGATHGQGFEPEGPHAYGPYADPLAEDYLERRGIRLEYETTEDAYILKLHIGELDPAGLEILPSGRAVRIRSTRLFQRQRSDDWGAYRFEHHYSSFSHRVPVPRDADVARLQRRDSDGLITVTLPRRQGVYRF
jgi:HSP20 family molecular chaperone IbpA